MDTNDYKQNKKEKPVLYPGGLFTELISVGFFIFILLGVSFAFIRYYPQLVQVDLSTTPASTPELSTQDPKSLSQTPDEQPNPLTIRGSISGIDASLDTIDKVNQSLDINTVSGYREGIQSALISSRNWYDLNTELFAVHGVQLGVASSHLISERTPEGNSLQQALLLSKQINDALSRTLTTNTSVQDINLYQSELQSFAVRAKGLINRLERELVEEQSKLNQQQLLLNDARDVFNESLTHIDRSQIDRSSQLYLDSSKELEKARINTAQIQPVLESLRTVFTQLQARISQVSTL